MSEGEGFPVEFVTPSGTAWKGDVRWISVMASDGLLEVHPGHAPMVCALGKGPALIDLGPDLREALAVFGGVLHVEKDRTSILSPRVELAKTIDGEAALAEVRSLEAKLPGAAPGEIAALKARMAEALIRHEAWSARKGAPA